MADRKNQEFGVVARQQVFASLQKQPWLLGLPRLLGRGAVGAGDAQPHLLSFGWHPRPKDSLQTLSIIPCQKLRFWGFLHLIINSELFCTLHFWVVCDLKKKKKAITSYQLCWTIEPSDKKKISYVLFCVPTAAFLFQSLEGSVFPNLLQWNSERLIFNIRQSTAVC